MERRGRAWVPLPESGLAENALVREGVGEALQTQVVVPRCGKAFVLFVQVGEEHVVIANDGAAPLLDGNVIVPPILCEAPDYVK